MGSFEVLRLQEWHVSDRGGDDLATIATENGTAVAVQPRYADKKEWKATAAYLVDLHNRSLDYVRIRRKGGMGRPAVASAESDILFAIHHHFDTGLKP